MDAIGNISQVIRAPQAASAPVILPTRTAEPQLPRPSGETLADITLQANAADARREQVLHSAARNAPQPLGSQVFTMFKDATGQMITRFRDQNSGKVTYIPEPDLLNMSQGASSSVINIKI